MFAVFSSASSRGPGGSSRGFTLIEVIVVIAVITLLAGLLVPIVTSVTQESRVAKILAVCDALKKSCERHRVDTGKVATEFSGRAYSKARYHQLALKQTYPGWRGAYIDHPLSSSDNPYGGFVYLYGSFRGGKASPGGGFNLIGGPKDTATGVGQFVAFGSIPPDLARAVDETLDKDMEGDWTNTGRIEYDERKRALMVYLLDF